MLEKIEKLMNSTCKEDILLAFALVKHNTGIQSPIVIFWYIDKRTDNPWVAYGYKDRIKLQDSDDWDTEVEIYYSELE